MFFRRAADCYNRPMKHRHPKSIRRRLLLLLYEHYLGDPLDMLTPEQLHEEGCVTREELQPNIFYLSDRGLVELMTDYKPPMFSGARITADGIDLVENLFEFNLRFPPELGEYEDSLADVPVLMERLVEEAELSALDGERRRSLLRDVQYLRDELVRPPERWRGEVIHTVTDWIEGYFRDAEEGLPSLIPLKKALEGQLRLH